MPNHRSKSDPLSEDRIIEKLRGKSRARRTAFATLTDIGGDPPPRDHNRPLRKLTISHVAPDALKPAKRRARRTSSTQIERVKRSLIRFGFVLPIVINEENEIIAGHILWAAAMELGYETIPCTSIDGLLPHEQEALAIALNRLGETGEWDLDALKLVIEDQIELGHEVISLGFDPATIDLLLEDDEAGVEGDDLPSMEKVAVSRVGDIWACAAHRVGCGDARDRDFILCLFEDDQVRLFFVDSPYNLKIAGNVTGKSHREFAMASGEMDETAFRIFQLAWLAVVFDLLVPGGYVLSCMDWRHIAGHITCGETAGFELANLIVWSKPNPGQGSLWRSAHELIAALRKPGGKSINNINLGSGGRSKSNVWTYPGGASLHSDIRDALGAHPTPKSLAMVADAILDVTHRGDVVADTFLGSGTSLLAADKTGRRFRGLEIDPLYVDLAIRRWEQATGQEAVLISTGETFAAVAARRALANPQAPPETVDRSDIPGHEDGEDSGPSEARPPEARPPAVVLALPKPRLRIAAPSRKEG